MWQGIATALLALCGFFFPVQSSADNLTLLAKPSNDRQPLTVMIGKSVIIDMPMAIKRASLANPAIADAIVLSPKQIYVAGKAFGTTNLSLWGKDEQVFTIFDVEVTLDLSRLREDMGQLFPDEPNIHATAVHDHITLWGSISTAERRDQALAVAEAYAPKKVVNFLQFEAPKVTAEPVTNSAADRASQPLPELTPAPIVRPVEGPSTELVTMSAAGAGPKPLAAEPTPEKPKSVMVEVIRGTAITHVTTK